jgi:hypothetical protein
MNVPTIQISKEKAQELYEDYAEVVLRRKEKYLEDLKKIYLHLSKGHKIVDIYEAFKKSGVNEEGDPNLAIVRADAKKCVFHKQDLGGGYFSESQNWNDRKIPARFDVNLPTATFPEWKTGMVKVTWNDEEEEGILRQTIQTKTTICPAHLLPNGELENYYLLWEVDKWDEVPVAKDPFLLRKINANAFLILAEWDLTEIEQAVIRGM